MATRGVIARRHGDGYSGRYHHWDSYPSGLGKTLYNLYHGHFKKDLSKMLQTLMDDHPAGWSTINDANWKKKPGFVARSWELDVREDRPQCYCHGDRNEEAYLVTHENAFESGCDFGYIFDETNLVMSVIVPLPNGGMRLLANVPLNDEEPDWELIENKEYEESL